jgi:hypothetical protein
MLTCAAWDGLAIAVTSGPGWPRRLNVNVTDAPPRDMPLWKFHCPSCKRDGVMGFRSLLTKEPLAPEHYTCPDCNVGVEILGRHDQ